MRATTYENLDDRQADRSRHAGKQVVFVTNNSTKSRADYKKKLETLGIPSSTVCHSRLELEMGN